jgi:phage protein D
MINFSKLKLTEGMDPIEQATSDKALESSQKQNDPTKRNKQKKQMSQAPSVRTKSGTIYTEQRKYIEMEREYNKKKSDWRSELIEEKETEEEEMHPYVDIMPMMDTKLKRAKRQYKNPPKSDNASEPISSSMDAAAMQDALSKR